MKRSRHDARDAETIDDAINFAARIPAARLGGAIEVRPSEQYW